MLYLPEFITSRVAAGLSAKTIEWYSWMLDRYAEFCAASDFNAHAPATVEKFFVVLRRNKQSAATVDGHYRALRVYFRWLVRRGLVETNPLDVVDRPRRHRQRTRHVTLSEFQHLYDCIGEDSWPEHRDRAMLVVMFYSGLRVGELTAMRRGDVDLSRRLIVVQRGKGGNSRIVPCAPLLSASLHAYLDNRPACDTDWLWLSNDGNGGVRGSLSSEGVRMMLRRRCKAANMRYINPHQFRHGFAMTLLNAGMELSAVSAAMGHSSQSVTEQIYAAWLTDGLSREYAEALRRLGAGT